jgi:putative ABC transport system substrate-binding protein
MTAKVNQPTGLVGSDHQSPHPVAHDGHWLYRRGMDRRSFLLTSLGGALAAPLAAEAQQAKKVYRIGLFHVGLDHVPPSVDGLRAGLNALGYNVGTAAVPKVSTVIEGPNIRLDWRNLADEDAALETARSFVRDRVDVIVACENQAVRAAQAATSAVPIVFVHVTDPVAEGFVKTLSRPGANLTGMSDYYGELHSKRLQLFTELVPDLRRLLILTDRTDPATARLLASIRRESQQLKLQLVERNATTETDLTRIYASLKTGDVDGVAIVSPNLITKFPSLILKLSSERRLPLGSHRKEMIQQGALFSYGPNYSALGRDVAGYVDRILKGAKPTDLPVQQASSLEFVINLKTAKVLGLTIPPSLLLRVDQVLE